MQLDQLNVHNDTTFAILPHHNKFKMKQKVW